MTIWLTRPRDDSAALATALAAKNLRSIIAPVLEIQPLPVSLPTTMPDAILLTSRHAAHALPIAWAQLPVYCVGAATAEAAQAAGYRHLCVGAGDMLALLPELADALRGQSLFYLSGEDISVDVAALLAAQQVEVQRAIAYRASAAEQLPPLIRDALEADQLRSVVFFSARTARITEQLLRAANLTHLANTLTAYCLSLTVAQAAATLPWRRLQVAHTPTNEAMLAMMTLNN